jgi:hypothetical protein
MSHDKAIRAGKGRRKPYRGSKDADERAWQDGNRAHRDRRRDAGRIDDWKNETETDEKGDRHD